MRKKRSVFRGVTWSPNHKNKWRADVQPVDFHAFYPSEMEAVAHYNAIATTLWPENAYRLLTEVNNQWKGRPEPPRSWDKFGRRVIDIDHDFITVVDERDYTEQKDFHWFVRNNHATRIVHCWVPEPGETPSDIKFGYVTLEQVVKGAMDVVHLNDDTLDNRRNNLATPDEVQAGQTSWSSEPLSKSNFDEMRKLRTDPRYARFNRDIEEWRRFFLRDPKVASLGGAKAEGPSLARGVSTPPC